MNLIVRATQIEAFRRLTETEYGTHDDFVRTISGTVEENEAMRLGTAVHRVLELYNNTDKHPTAYECSGHIIDGESIANAGSFLTPLWLREVRATKTVDGSPYNVTITGATDVVLGNVIVDHKTTLKAIDDRKIQAYEASMQWRVYLWLFGATDFYFNLLQWREASGVWFLTDREHIHCTAYEGMEADVMSCLLRMLDYCAEHDLIKHLTKEPSNERTAV